MKFRTEYKAVRSDITLRPELPLVTIGSCFADNISARMRGAMWDAANPLGVLFNPLSICNALDIAVSHPSEHSRIVFENSLFEADGMTHSWFFDSSMSAPSRAEIISKFEQRSRRIQEMLDASRVLFVTLGTAFCYILKATGTTVSNCHKQPQSLFERDCLPTSRFVMCLDYMVECLQERFPDIRIVFTVSPVRHVRDGLAENSLSKAKMRLTVDELCSRHSCCSYFPAYEILTDDLRDYRFYASDLVHPSDQAIEYIWEIFRQTYLDEEGLRYVREGEALMKRAAHRPILMSPEQYADFKAETDSLIADFRARHARVNART